MSSAKDIDKAVFSGAPTFARALISDGHKRAIGREVARHTYAYFSGEGLDCEESYQELLDAVQDNDRDSVLVWCRDRFPGVMQLIQEDDEDYFVDGVLQAWDEGLMDR